MSPPDSTPLDLFTLADVETAVTRAVQVSSLEPHEHIDRIVSQTSRILGQELRAAVGDRTHADGSNATLHVSGEDVAARVVPSSVLQR